MKMVSLADVVQKTDKTPNIIEYFGYTLCGANVMLGPWVSFDVYLNYVEKKPEKKVLLIQFYYHNNYITYLEYLLGGIPCFNHH